METPKNSSRTSKEKIPKKGRKWSKLRRLKLSLKYRPEIFRMILKLRECIRKKNKLLQKAYKDLNAKKAAVKTDFKNVQTELDSSSEKQEPCETKVILAATHAGDKQENAGWSLEQGAGDGEKSIAEQVKEAAQSAMAESGMVYIESAGMYYDYKTGYYYNSELGLYYHTDTGCYYYYSDEKQTFVFHSYPDRSKENAALIRHEKKKAKKHKQDKEDHFKGESKPKKTKNKERKSMEKKPKGKKCKEKKTMVDENGDKGANDETKGDDKKEEALELEDGECSESEAESEVEKDSVATDSTVTDDEDTVSKHHPPCMRVIVRETSLPKLKVGSLFLVTKDGGTVGREGEQHCILLKDVNVSRTHLEIKYDMSKRAYFAVDLGSKNGTILNGKRISESQVASSPIEIQHGSTLHIGETKLLCHVHPGTDTCGHCEPGLIMAEDDKDKRVAYTRTCDVQKQHQLELARLKNKYAAEPLAIEDGSYKDRAKERREAVGSSHHSEKTQQADLDTNIAPDNKGFKLLEKMGWSKGEGLGKESQGNTEPIPLVSNENKAGLGSAGSAAPVQVGAIGSVPLRVSRPRAKPLRPPARLFRDPLEEDD